MDFVIRLATLDDVDALVEIGEVAFGGEEHTPLDRTTRRQWRYLLTKAHGEVYMIEGDGRAVGFADVILRAGTSVVHGWSIALLPEARDQGAATALFAWVEKRWIDRGFDRVSFEVHVNNPAAVRLYERLGYEVTEVLPDYFAAGDDGLRMVKRLTPE